MNGEGLLIVIAKLGEHIAQLEAALQATTERAENAEREIERISAAGMPGDVHDL